MLFYTAISYSIFSSLLKNREIWGSSALVLNLAVVIEISGPGMAWGFLSALRSSPRR